MHKFLKVAGVALVAALVAPLAGQAKVIKAMGSTAYLGKKIKLVCWIDGYFLLNVGSVTRVRKGTPISFIAKLANAGLYARTIPLPRDIPPHLFVTFTGLPVFERNSECEAWWIRRPVLAPPR